MSINDIQVELDSNPVKVRVLYDTTELFFSGEKLGPLKAGTEIELPFWMGQELAKSKIAKILDREPLDMATLAKNHWRESIPSSHELPPAEYNFYHKLRWLLLQLRDESLRDPLKKTELEKAESQSRDIINCRARKILYFAAAPPQPESIFKKLAAEERVLYEQLCNTINDWKHKVLGLEGEK